MADSVRVEIDPTEVLLTPGSSPATLTVRVVNATRIVDEFRVEVIGTGQWLSAEPGSVRLFPEAEGTVELALSISRGLLVPAGDRVVGIRATSVANSAVTWTERLKVVVGEVAAEESITLEPQMIHGGSDGQALVRARNRGNTPLNLAFSGEDPERAVRFTFDPPVVAVPPGGEGWSRLSISAPQAMSGGGQTRAITVRAEGGHGPLVATGSFVQTPRVTGGTLLSLRVALTLVGSVAMIAGAFLAWTGGSSPLKGTDLDYVAYLRFAFGVDLARPSTALSTATFTTLTSGGLLAIVLGAVALLGLATRKGLPTRIAAGLAFVLLAAVAITLAIGSNAPPVGLGVVLSVIGALVALIGGLLARRG